MIVVIDNYDSFVHNLARLVRLAGQDTKIIRNDAMSVEQVLDLNPAAIIISPGPNAPKDAGISVGLIKAAYRDIPILGVCLGHQCIGEVFGGQVERAKQPMHGMASVIRHDESRLFNGLPNPMAVGRYHSLIVKFPEPSILKVTARSEQGEIMAFEHPDYPVYGVQFHPESILTDNGIGLIRNFLETI
ncbi:MAG: aminodeoxychorismate/anthranilate synthase component II [Alphaproteobacteria bacterium RIFCSPHIGHO2_12_FULL_45_9]|nr:MAG: aminodeoxychorismate/anthranilate synthase component II [Alphaproteobacteria bacterium RIFCSPHIGHO2_02_FULL_46_13]OFW98781.1 MAG: aminodeoxychorismate/anthranilate synthase component II [Alphaproteobacteria bacterium RIFCSPHIGHO2_12_FULL_45_9]